MASPPTTAAPQQGGHREDTLEVVVAKIGGVRGDLGAMA
jgi:hypothetical protein